MTAHDVNIQLSSTAQLDTIDKLRDCGVGHFIDLPQIVAVVERVQYSRHSWNYHYHEIKASVQDSELRSHYEGHYMIDKQLSDCKKRLAELGSERESSDQQRVYLQDIAINFQQLTDYALDAYYARDAIFDKVPAFRLPTLVVDRSENFSDHIEKKGHTISFRLPEEAEENLSNTSRVVINAEDDCEDEIGIESDTSATPEEDFEYPELSDFLHTHWSPQFLNDSNIIEWIETEYRNSRGFGLESIGPAVLPNLWKKQSQNWEGITMVYMSDIIKLVHDFIYKLLEHVCPDDRVRSALISMLQETLLERYKAALAHATWVVNVERMGTPQTMNYNYTKNLQENTRERLNKDMQRLSNNHNNSKAFQIEELNRMFDTAPDGNSKHTITEIHSILRAYYEVARTRFVDTICMQATDCKLLRGENCPLRLFSPQYVARLSDQQLDMIAGEDSTNKRLRKTLKAEIQALEEGKKLLRA